METSQQQLSDLKVGVVFTQRATIVGDELLKAQVLDNTRRGQGPVFTEGHPSTCQTCLLPGAVLPYEWNGLTLL